MDNLSAGAPAWHLKKGFESLKLPFHREWPNLITRKAHVSLEITRETPVLHNLPHSQPDLFLCCCQFRLCYSAQSKKLVQRMIQCTEKTSGCDLPAIPRWAALIYSSELGHRGYFVALKTRDDTQVYAVYLSYKHSSWKTNNKWTVITDNVPYTRCTTEMFAREWFQRLFCGLK